MSYTKTTFNKMNNPTRIQFEISKTGKITVVGMNE